MDISFEDLLVANGNQQQQLMFCQSELIIQMCRPCYHGRHTNREDNVSSTCGLPEQHSIHAVYGGMNNDSRFFRVQ